MQEYRVDIVMTFVNEIAFAGDYKMSGKMESSSTTSNFT